VFHKLFAKRRNTHPPALAAGRRLYAIGDIHGRLDLFEALLEKIFADASGAPCPGADRDDKVLVLLGDYVDRGPDSRGVIERLCHFAEPGFEVIALLGNHEDVMMQFLSDPSVGPRWCANGGDATLASYGVSVPAEPEAPDEVWQAVSAAFNDALPATHRGFLRRLAPWYAEGGYLFVHAGLRPGVAVEKQDVEDLIWIRQAFTSSTRDHGALVVHGHSITPEPDFQPNRIGIDTGAYASGVLTCLALAGTRRRILHTGG
jgi:serine/threonine protein phosphatase 1